MSAAQLSWNAATLDERVAFLRGRADHLPPTDGASPLDDACAPWLRACAAGDVDAFLRRLAWDDIDLAVARGAMSPHVPEAFPPAPWSRQLPDVMATLKAAASTSADTWEQEVTRLGADLPYVDLWMPLVLGAGRDLFDGVPASGRWLSAQARAALERHLAAGLCRLGELAVHAQAEAFFRGSDAGQGERYRAFVRTHLESGGARLFSAHPVLARQVLDVTQQWKHSVQELVGRLEADQAALEATFGVEVGAVQELRAGLSDRHDAGRQVMCLTFASGLRLAYKPRNIAVEQAYNACLAWMVQAGMSAVPPALRTVARATHGWVEWVEPGTSWTPDEARMYFRQAGVLVGLTYVLGAADLHSENLVASRSGPVLVDTEMLLQPSTRPGAPTDGGDESEVSATADSCLLSGLVSAVVIDRNGVGFDVGGLRPAGERELAIPARHWIDLRTDGLMFRQESRVRPHLRNEVIVAGVAQGPDAYADDVCAGFADTCRFLHERRDAFTADNGPLSALAGCAVRVLFRPSDQYAAALFLTAAPRYQASGLARSLAFEMLYRVFVSEHERPRIWPLVSDERAALERLDVPRVTLPASSTTLTSSTGATVDGYYVRSGIEAARARLRALGPGEQRAQVDLLRAALAPESGPSVPGPRPSTADDRLLAAAERIGAAVLARAVTTPAGALVWPSSGGRTDLYGGSSGIGVFLAALGVLTGDRSWASAARQVLAPCADAADAESSAVPRLGACTGRPSDAYALALTGCLMGESSLLGAGRELVCRTPAAAIQADTVLDVEGGVAGLLLVALAIQAVDPDARLLALARRCVDRLLLTQIPEGRHQGAWLAGDVPVARPGFAHGAAGIAAALSRWVSRGEDSATADAVRAAWSFERRVADANGGRYPTERSDGSRLVMAAWCHGAPGVALGRVLAPTSLVDTLVRQDLQAALQQTLTAPAGPLDHLCCGNLGRADVALTTGLAVGVSEWVDGGRSLAEGVAGRVLGQGRLGMRGRGFQRGAASPELFQGLAGIGYQLLRTAAPDRVPSLLAFDVPAAGVSRGAYRKEPS